MILEWKLHPGGLIAKGKKTYHIFKTCSGVALQIYGSKGYERLGTFTGDSAMREARAAALDYDRKLRRKTTL